MPDHQWYSMGARSFTDRRMQLRRTGELVRYGVRAFHGVIIKRGENGKPEYDHCPHAHNKQSAARKCAEKEARRRNREEAKNAKA